MIIANLAENFIPSKGEKVLVSDRSDNNGRTWYYLTFEQENQEKDYDSNFHTTSTGNSLSRFLGTYIVTRVYRKKVIIRPVQP